MKNKQPSSSNSINSLILFLIFPLIAFFNSVRRIYLREHFWIVLLFALFFSYTYIPIPNSDTFRYIERFNSIEDYTLPQYLQDVSGIYSGASEDQDVYIYSVQFLISPFAADIRVYWLVLGFVYFYTFLSLIKFIISSNLSKTRRFNWFILGVVFLISFTAGINGIRWPLALMVFLLGSYRYITTSKFKFIALAFLSVFIHFILFYLILFLLIFVVSKRFYNPKVTSLFVLIVFFISSFYVSRVQSSSGILGKGISEATSGYIENEAWQEQRLEEFEKVNWYVQLQRTAPYNFVMLALIVVVFFGAKLKKSPAVRALEYFALLNFLASSLSAQLLVLSDNRFNISATAFGLVYLYYLYNENSETRLVNRIMQLYIPIAVLTILVNLRSDLYTVSPNIVFGNVITEFIYRFDESIQELVGL